MKDKIKKEMNYDFADEAYQSIKNENVIQKISSSHYLKVNHLQLLKDDLNFQKKKGDYYSFELLEMNTKASYDQVKKELAKHLKRLINKRKVKRKPLILVVGLGNEEYAPDSLGPRVVKKMNATTHLLQFTDLKVETKVACLIPGVMALTGLESAEIIKSLVAEFKIDLIIAIDALATSDLNRMNKVIQMTDTGISPGRGIQNFRKELKEEFLKIPVIALGVATIVESRYIVLNTLQELINLGFELSEQEKHKLIAKCSSQLILTSKEIDKTIELLTSLIADAINYALNPKLNIN